MRRVYLNTGQVFLGRPTKTLIPGPVLPLDLTDIKCVGLELRLEGMPSAYSFPPDVKALQARRIQELMKPIWAPAGSPVYIMLLTRMCYFSNTRASY